MDESSTSAIFSRDAENPSVCVVDGYGVSITTSSGRLRVSDGIGTNRRERIYSRANHGLARLVVMASTGGFSIEAVRWLEGAGVPFVVLDPSTGDFLAASVRVANDDARLRRAQALAPGTGVGLEIAAYLTRLKLAGQASVASDRLGAKGVAQTIGSMAPRVDDSSTLEQIRQIEASAANLFWSAWGTLNVTFVKKDAPRVPENWLGFEGRRSAIMPGSPRNASDPINAMLNYLYRILEAEGHLATLAVGLDPGLGILHADVKGRASFVLDVIDAVRPLAELHVLNLIESQPLRWRDFHEDSRGVVRVLAPLSHRLAEAMPGFAASLAPVVERVAQMVGSISPYDVSNPSILTREKHRSAARRRVAATTTDSFEAQQTVGPGSAGLLPRKKRRQKAPTEFEAALPLPICKGCGAALDRESDRLRRRGAYCPQCLQKRRVELGSQLPRLAARAATTSGVESRPTHTDEASKRRRKANSAQRQAQAEWDAKHPDANRDPKWFRGKILPKLSVISITRIAQATDMSTSSASKIRAGRRIPHPRHWAALSQLVAQTRPLETRS